MMKLRLKNCNWKKVIRWTPRVLVIFFAAFISLFAFDSFTEFPFPESIVAFIIHLIPTFVLVGLLLVAWKWPKLGGVAFLVLAIAFQLFFNREWELISFLLLSLPLLVISGLFFLDWLFSISKY